MSEAVACSQRTAAKRASLGGPSAVLQDPWQQQAAKCYWEAFSCEDESCATTKLRTGWMFAQGQDLSAHGAPHPVTSDCEFLVVVVAFAVDASRHAAVCARPFLRAPAFGLFAEHAMPWEFSARGGYHRLPKWRIPVIAALRGALRLRRCLRSPCHWVWRTPRWPSNHVRPPAIITSSTTMIAARQTTSITIGATTVHLSRILATTSMFIGGLTPLIAIGCSATTIPLVITIDDPVEVLSVFVKDLCLIKVWSHIAPESGCPIFVERRGNASRNYRVDQGAYGSGRGTRLEAISSRQAF
ncbi:hypothetical protein BGW80DRAFT_492272 [Lactifluus volemus]|nr:hypothetical protein BGW80DRAFT_492272 [Lactifluus volemus]